MPLPLQSREVTSRMDAALFQMRAISELTEVEIARYERFARDRAGQATPTDYLRKRLEQYDAVLLAYDPSGLAALQLVQSVMGEDRQLVYFGPSFSRSRAYVGLFIWHVSRLLAVGKAFWLAAEVENQRVVDDFVELLGPAAFPGTESIITSADGRRVLEAFANRIDHISDFDPETLTTGTEESLCGARVRYRLVLTGWDGSAEERGLIASEIQRRVIMMSRFGNQGHRTVAARLDRGSA